MTRTSTLGDATLQASSDGASAARLPGYLSLLLIDLGLVFGPSIGITIGTTAANVATTNVAASQAASLQADPFVKSFTVRDTAANIAAYFDSLNSDTKLAGMTLATTGPLTISATQFAKDSFIVSKLPPGTTFILTGVTVAAATAIQANTSLMSFSINDTAAAVAAIKSLSAYSKLTAIGVSDTVANILSNLATLSTDAIISSISLTGGSVLPVTQAQYSAYSKMLDLLAAGDSLSVAGATVAYAPTLQSDVHVGSFTVSDTASNVVYGLTRLALDTKLTSINLNGGSVVTVTGSQFGAYKTVLDKLASPDKIAVTGLSAANASTAAADGHVASFTISDTLANIGANLSTLETYAKNGELTAINVADTGQTLSLTPAQYAADTAAIALMKGSFNVTQTTAATHLTINVIWDPSTASAPAAWKNDIQYAVNYFEGLITTPVTVNIRVGYGEAGGYTLGSGTLGETVINTGTYLSTAQFKADLQNDVTSDSAVQSAIANIAGSNFSSVYISGAQEQAFGLLPATGSAVVASVGFAVDPRQNLFAYSATNRGIAGEFDFIGVVEHEFSHALGRVSYVGSATALDLYRYSSPGVHASAGAVSYFSINGGATKLYNFSTSSDTADWATSAGDDANDAYAPEGVTNAFTSTDVTQLNVLGYSLSTSPPSSTASTAVASVSTPSVSAASAGTVSAGSGLNAPSLTFIGGTPSTTSFSAAVTRLATALDAAPGVQEIAGFQYGIDQLTIDLTGISGVLEAFNTTVNGAAALALASSGDLRQGLVLTGLPSGYTAADLMAHHLTVSGPSAVIT